MPEPSPQGRPARPDLARPVDFHDGGRSSKVVVFESTVRLVYKPRPVEIEAVVNDFLAALMREGAPVGFRVTGVLPRGAYGWMEYVAHAPSRDQREATSYYERLGALLAVLYAVQATDVHAGNLVASGEYPSASTTSV